MLSILVAIAAFIYAMVATTVVWALMGVVIILFCIFLYAVVYYLVVKPLTFIGAVVDFIVERASPWN